MGKVEITQAVDIKGEVHRADINFYKSFKGFGVEIAPEDAQYAPGTKEQISTSNGYKSVMVEKTIEAMHARYKEFVKKKYSAEIVKKKIITIKLDTSFIDKQETRYWRNSNYKEKIEIEFSYCVMDAISDKNSDTIFARDERMTDEKFERMDKDGVWIEHNDINLIYVQDLMKAFKSLVDKIHKLYGTDTKLFQAAIDNRKYLMEGKKK